MSDSTEKLAGHEVAAWLRRHPGFLKQFPDLALTLVVPRDDGPTASLASYQLDVLRDKNRELSRRLADLGTPRRSTSGWPCVPTSSRWR